jgi:hypothetical protein
MRRILLRTAVLTVTVSAGMVPAAEAQIGPGNRPAAYHAYHSAGPTGTRGGVIPAPYHVAFRQDGRNAEDRPAPHPQQPPGAVPAPGGVPGAVAAAPTAAPGFPVLPGYPYLDASLSPTPQPYVPYQVGGTVITNQAFFPHEMLYPHTYRAMYPPYYYKVRGHWLVLPWGTQSSEHWQLQGTMVQVRYRSWINPLSGFHPPKVK